MYTQRCMWLDKKGQERYFLLFKIHLIFDIRVRHISLVLGFFYTHPKLPLSFHDTSPLIWLTCVTRLALLTRMCSIAAKHNLGKQDYRKKYEKSSHCRSILFYINVINGLWKTLSYKSFQEDRRGRDKKSNDILKELGGNVKGWSYILFSRPVLAANKHAGIDNVTVGLMEKTWNALYLI